MKAKDIGLLAVIAIISATLSLLLSGRLFSIDKNRSQNVEVVRTINTSLPPVDARYFNALSVNPAQDIRVGQDPNSNPFQQR